MLLELDPWLESAKALGPMIDPNIHSCGSVDPHGHRETSDTGYSRTSEYNASGKVVETCP
jgi:hypothetical protein